MENSLYQIRQDHIELLSAIEEADGELTPELEEALSLTQEQFQAKAISYGFVIKKFDDNLSLIEQEIKRLQALQSRAEAKKELFKQRLSDAMIEFGFEKINTPLLSLSFRKSESVEIENIVLLPANFVIMKEIYSADKLLIKSALKNGETIPGAQLVTKQNLQIK